LNLARDNRDVFRIQKQEMTIGIAGTGRMARALGALLVRRGVAVNAVGGRSKASAEDATRFIGLGQGVAVRELPRYSSHILVAVSDDAIGQVGSELKAGGLRDGVALHTSGAAGPDALTELRGAGNSVGAIHPLQTVPSAERGIETLPGAAFVFGGDRAASEWAKSLAAVLDGKPLAVDANFWQHYHAAAVTACNYQMTLVDVALEVMEMAGISRGEALDALGPILRATMENILAVGPERALTGPIRRGDVGTIRRHLAAMESALPETRRLYMAAGLRTVAVAERAGLDAGAAREVTLALNGGR
jgi:predicted short-subunit dehydrogenase-like oxidoreductase (DUF2520 family)